MKPLIACILVVEALLAFVSASRAETPAQATTKLDVTYKTTAQGPLKLDLHYPETPKSGAKYPLVLFTHGGGWSTGNKTIGERGGSLTANADVTVKSDGYSPCSKDPSPADSTSCGNTARNRRASRPGWWPGRRHRFLGECARHLIKSCCRFGSGG